MNNSIQPPLGCGKEIHRLTLWYKEILERSTFVTSKLTKVVDLRQNYLLTYTSG
jgi:hypothetical protein